MVEWARCAALTAFSQLSKIAAQLSRNSLPASVSSRPPRLSHEQLDFQRILEPPQMQAKRGLGHVIDGCSIGNTAGARDLLKRIDIAKFVWVAHRGSTSLRS